MEILKLKAENQQVFGSILMTGSFGLNTPFLEKG